MGTYVQVQKRKKGHSGRKEASQSRIIIHRKDDKQVVEFRKDKCRWKGKEREGGSGGGSAREFPKKGRKARMRMSGGAVDGWKGQL